MKLFNCEAFSLYVLGTLKKVFLISFVLILFCFAKIAQVPVEGNAFVFYLCMSLLKGQKPLYWSAFASVSPSEQKQMLGKRLFSLIQATYPDQAGKITDMLLEIDNTELLHMLECREALDAKAREAVSVLRAHNARLKAQFEYGV